MLRSFSLLLVLAASVACMDAPTVGRAADPTKAQGPAPWGSATSNAELDKKRQLLDDILDGRLTPELLVARIEKDWPELTPEQRTRQLSTVTEMLSDLQKSGRAGQRVSEGPDREMAKAQLFFSERRFIEASTILSKVLDTNPTYPSARNLLARCFFFLGNRDRAIVELEYILQSLEHQKDQGEIFDALFLMGAAVAETPGMSRENMQKGKGAWETYLKIAPPDSPMLEHVKKGLADIEAGLRGEGHLAQPVVPVNTGGFDNEGTDSRGALGGGNRAPPPMAVGGGDAAVQQAPNKRAQALPADASPVDRAVAEGWDALDIKDLATAEAKLSEALQASPGNAPALTGLGRVYVQSGRLNEAVRSFGEAIKVAPDYMPAWHYNGMAQLLAGSPAQAVSSWEKIQEKDPAYFAANNLAQRLEVARRMK